MTMANYTRNALFLLSTKVQQIWKLGIFQHLESKCLRKEFFMPALNFSHDIWQNILCWMALQRNKMLCLGINWFLEVIWVLQISRTYYERIRSISKIELNVNNFYNVNLNLTVWLRSIILAIAHLRQIAEGYLNNTATIQNCFKELKNIWNVLSFMQDMNFERRN